MTLEQQIKETKEIELLFQQKDYLGIVDIFTSPLKQANEFLDGYKEGIKELDKLIVEGSFKLKQDYLEFKKSVFNTSFECHTQASKLEQNCDLLKINCILFKEKRISGEYFLKVFHGLLDSICESSSKMEGTSKKFTELQGQANDLVKNLSGEYKSQAVKRIFLSVAGTIGSIACTFIGIAGCVIGCIMILTPTSVPMATQLAGLLTVKKSIALTSASVAATISGIASTGYFIYESVKGVNMLNTMQEEISSTTMDIQNILNEMSNVVKHLNELNGKVGSGLTTLTPTTTIESIQSGITFADIFTSNMAPACKNVKDSCEVLMKQATNISHINTTSNESNCMIL